MAALPSATTVPRAFILADLPVADSARLALAIGVAAMKYDEAAAIAGEIEPLHQMRVATRRLRATVRFFSSVIHGSRSRIYNRDLPWLGRAAGAVRECDMMEALIRDCGHHLDPTLAAALTPLAEAIATSRNAEHARFVEDLRTKRYRQMCEKLADPLLRRALPATDVGCNAPAMIAPIARSVRKAGKRIARDAPPELFHRLRVRIKRLRYALEMLTEMGGKRSRKALMRLEQMQELLGIHQDAVSTMAWLRTYAVSATGVAPETLMAVGATVQTLVERRQMLATRANRQWRKIVHSGVINDALEEISRAAQRRLEDARQAQAVVDSERQAPSKAHAQATASPGIEDIAPDAPERAAVVMVATDELMPESGVTDRSTLETWAPSSSTSEPDASERSASPAGASDQPAPGASATPGIAEIAPKIEKHTLGDTTASDPPTRKAIPATSIITGDRRDVGEQGSQELAAPDSSVPSEGDAAGLKADDVPLPTAILSNPSTAADLSNETPIDDETLGPADKLPGTPHHSES